MKKKYIVNYESVTQRKAYIEADSEKEARELFNVGEVIDDFHESNCSMNINGVQEIDEFPHFKYSEYDPRRHG